MTRNRELEQEVARLRAEAAAPENPKVIASLEVMAISMAMDKFGFKPGADRQPSATRSIVRAVEERGLRISEETVLARLRAAKQRLHD
jgi:hypothetical protein